METVEIPLATSEGCCIECAAKRAYNKLALDIMTSEDNPGPEVEARLDLLLEFLEHADFSQLRGSDEALAGTRDAQCLLKRSGDGTPHVSIVDE